MLDGDVAISDIADIQRTMQDADADQYDLYGDTIIPTAMTRSDTQPSRKQSGGAIPEGFEDVEAPTSLDAAALLGLAPAESEKARVEPASPAAPVPQMEAAIPDGPLLELEESAKNMRPPRDVLKDDLVEHVDAWTQMARLTSQLIPFFIGIMIILAALFVAWPMMSRSDRAKKTEVIVINNGKQTGAPKQKSTYRLFKRERGVGNTPKASGVAGSEGGAAQAEPPPSD